MEIDLAERPDDGVERGLTFHLTAVPRVGKYLHRADIAPSASTAQVPSQHSSQEDDRWVRPSPSTVR